MEDKERQQLMQRCHDAELRAKTLAECLEVIAGKFAPITATVLGMRVNRLEDTQATHGARLGDLETNDKRQDDRLDKASAAHQSLTHEVRRHAFKTQATPRQPVEHVRTAGPEQAAQANKA